MNEIKIWFLCGLFFVCTNPSRAQCTNEGKEFYLVFPENIAAATTPLSLRLYITTSERDTKVDVIYGTNTVLNVNVRVGQITTITLPNDPCHLVAKRAISSRAGVHVKSTDGTRISVYGISRKTESTDAFTAIPLEALGTRYRLSTYTLTATSPGEVAVIATEDSTTVTFDLPTANPNPTTIKLDSRQAYVIGDANSVDMSGGLISSDKPIAVFGAHVCAFIPSATPYCDHLLEQLLPVNLWGKLFYISPFQERMGGDMFRMYADSDLTELYINGVTAGIINAGQFLESNILSPSEIYATKPIQVAQYSKSSTAGGSDYGDPFMMILPPQELFLDGFNFTTPTGADVYPSNWLTIIAPTAHIGKVRLDGNPVALWAAIPTSFGTMQFSVANVKVTVGQHKIYYDPLPPYSEKFTLAGYVYGFSPYDSYGYFSSVGIHPSAKISVDTPFVFASLLCPNEPPSEVIDTVFNRCRGILRISSMKIMGTDSLDFALLEPIITTPIDLEADLGVQFRLRFVPKTPGDKLAYLRIISNDKTSPIVDVPLHGHKDSAAIFTVPVIINYSNISCNDVDTLITVTNTGTVTDTVTAATFSQNGLTVLSPALPFAISSGGSEQVRIRLNTSILSAGVYSSELTLSATPCNLMNRITFTAYKDSVGIFSVPAIINYGDVFCNDVDTLITVTNTGTVTDTVTAATFSQNGLTVLSPALPFAISSGGSEELRIRLNTSMLSAGTYSSELTLSAMPCKLMNTIAFTANRKSLSYLANPAFVDFGITVVGKTISGKVSIENQNNTDVRVSAARFESSTFPGILTTKLPKIIISNGSLDVDFTVTPPDTQIYEAMICITLDSPCTDVICIPVKVEGASACLTLETFSTSTKHPGETAMIPVTITSSTKLTTAKKIDVAIKYDGELLRLAGKPEPTIGEISNIAPIDGGVSFSVTPNTTLTPTATIARLPMRALLAPRATGVIEVVSSVITLNSDERIAGGNCPATFSLDSSCIMPSDLKPYSVAEIEGVYPNPSYTRTTVAISAKNNPTISLEVYDVFGRQVEVLHNGSLTAGKHEIIINTGSYATGIYFCRLFHNGQINTKAFNVTR